MKKSKMINNILKVLISIGILIIGLILILLCSGDHTTTNLIAGLAPIGILISAFIASATLTKSINNTNYLYKKGKKEKQNTTLTYLYHNIYDGIRFLPYMKETGINDIEMKKTTANDIKEILKQIDNENTFFHLKTTQNRFLFMKTITSLKSIAYSIETNKSNEEIIHWISETINNSHLLIREIEKIYPKIIKE